jgi:hypothetical protein
MSTLFVRPSKAAGVEKFAAENQECARIILADPRRYSGVLSEWAVLVLRGAPRTRAAWRLPA